MKAHNLHIYFLLILGIFSCGSPGPETYDVDLSDNQPEVQDTLEEPVLRVAIATVISPRESFIYYQEMFEALSDHLNMPVEFKQRSTYKEVNELLATNMVDIAFICSGAYIQGSEYFELMFVPLVEGKPYYQGYIITNTSSDIYRFEDFKGRSFTYSDPMCFTGSIFVKKRLKELAYTEEEFFGETVYSLSHDLSIQMVSRNVVDGAAINGLIFEYLSHSHPEYLTDIRIIEKTEPGGIPPVVNSLLMPRELRTEIQNFFTTMHNDPYTRGILDSLLIDRFIITGDTLYDGLREDINEIIQ